MIRAQGLQVRRGGRLVLDLPSLAIGGGQLFGILGPNGAGKSTLLRVLAGELRPDAGAATFDGKPVRDWRPGDLACRRAVLPQASALGFPLDAAEVVALGRLPHAGRARRGEDARAVRDAMLRAGVLPLASRAYLTLSGGEQQRVQLARVLAQLAGTPPDQAALFLDEPTSALDLLHQHAIMAAARGLARSGVAVIAVMHDLMLAGTYCDRLLLLSEGTALAEGPPEAVLRPDLVGRAYGLAVRRIEDPEAHRIVLVPAA
jgi:iron complex transport system ATP-binding protein